MEEGKLNRRLEAYTGTTADNNSGGQIITLVLAATVWASKKQLSFGRQLQFNQTYGIVGYEFIVRYNPSLIFTTDMKFVSDSKTIVPTSVEDVDNKGMYVKIIGYFKDEGSDITL